MTNDLPLLSPARCVLQVGDLHLRQSALADQVPVLDWVAAQLPSWGVDTVVVAGDLTGRACPHLARPSEREALLGFLRQCRAQQAHVVVLRGNHDVRQDWRWLREVPGVTWVEVPTVLHGAAATIRCLPWPDRSWAAAGDPAPDLATALGAALEGLLEVWADEDRSGPPALVCGHLGTVGATTSSGQPLVGLDLAVRPRAGTTCLLNHVHLPQQHGQVHHVGSPWCTDFGEAGEVKRVVVWTAATGEIRSFPTPAVPWATVDLTWAGDRWEGDTTCPVGARVRVRLRYAAGESTGTLPAIPGARDLTVEARPARRVEPRAPTVAAAADPLARFEAFEAAAGRAVEDEVRAIARDVIAGVE